MISSLFAYTIFVLEIFVPGTAIALLLKAWRDDEGLAEVLALAFGFGLATVTVVFLVGTSGLFHGLNKFFPYIPIVLGIFIFPFASRRKMPRVGWRDLLLFSIIGLLGLMLFLHFSKYPIFPAYQSADYANHVAFTQGLISGSLTSIPHGILYFGVHFQLASAILLAGGSLVTVERAMAILVLFSPLMVYLASSRVFFSKGAALVISAIYSLSGTLWFIMVFDSGLYANFFGLLSSLFLLAVIVELFRNIRSRYAWISFALALIMAYFSHYTAITLLPSLFVVPLIQYLRRERWRMQLLPAISALSPAVIAFLSYPKLVALLINLAENGGGTVIGKTAISQFLAGIPVLEYLVIELADDIAFVSLTFFAAFFVYNARRMQPTAYIPLVWFLSLLFTAPQNISAWRFSLEALLPFTLIAGYGLYLIIPRLKIKQVRWSAIPIAILLLMPVISTSLGQQMVYDSLQNASMSSKTQHEVYNAIMWLGSNTPANSSYLSLTDWRFTYTGALIGRTTYLLLTDNLTQAFSFAYLNGVDYIIATNITNPPIYYGKQDPWLVLRDSSNMTLVYANRDVEVFRVSWEA